MKDTGATRRSVLQACVGATVGALSAPGYNGTTQNDISTEYLTQQAKFFKKYAKQLEQSFDTYKEAFNYDTTKNIELLVASQTPGLSDMLPPPIGTVVKLYEKLDWYDDVGKNSPFQAVANKGAIGPDDTGPTGSPTLGSDLNMSDAYSQLETVANNCGDVVSAAGKHVEDPDSAEANWRKKVKTLIDSLDDCEAIEDWSEIDPQTNEYKKGLGGGGEGIEDTAEKVKDNAQAIVDIRDVASEELSTKIDIIEKGGTLALPAAIAKYNTTLLPTLKEEIAPVVFNRVAGDNYRIKVKADSEEEVEEDEDEDEEDGLLPFGLSSTGGDDSEEQEDIIIRWINTNGNGRVTDFELKDQDSADANITIDNSRYHKIKTPGKDHPAAVAQTGFDEDEITIEGNHFFSKGKYWVISSLSDVNWP